MTASVDALLVKNVWENLRVLAKRMASSNPLLEDFSKQAILGSSSMAAGLSKVLSRQNFNACFSNNDFENVFYSIYEKDPQILAAAAADILAVTERDPACGSALYPFLFFKGYHALQTYRAAHWLWENGQKETATFLQNHSSVLYTVDIHPAAKIGRGIMLDHAHSIVIGETAVVEDNVSMLHEVTLGGTGKEHGDRHPKIRQGVMIGAGAKILGNVEVGACASVAAGSVVLSNVPPHTTVAGIPAKVMGKPKTDVPAQTMDQSIPSGSGISKILGRG